MAILMLERDRAADAWAAVRETAGLSPEIQGRYRSQVRGGPAMVQRNGLGQFFAFLAAKGFENGNQLKANRDQANGVLYQHLGRWLVWRLQQQPNPPARTAVVPGGTPMTDPMAFLFATTCTLQQTMYATGEALAWMQWARRFAESQLAAPADDHDEA